MSMLSPSWPKRLIVAFSMAVFGSSVFANDNVSDEGLSFSCEEPDQSSWTTRADHLQYIFSSVVAVQPSGSPNKVYGSGFFISNDGYIVTNAHVASGLSTGFVNLYDTQRRNYLGEPVPYQLIGQDLHTDIAVLKVEMDQPNNCLIMNLDVPVGYNHNIIAIGHPFRQWFTMTKGVVSMPKRTASLYTDFVQIDAAINPGNSGGPSLKENGLLIGVNVRNVGKVQQSASLGYVIPIETVRRIAEQLIREGEVPYSFVGLRTQNSPENAGVLVESFFEHSPADLAGLQVGDHITHVNQNPVEDGIDLIRIVVPNHPGTTFTLSVERDGRQFETMLTVEDKITFNQRVAIIEQQQQAASPAFEIGGN